MDSRKLRSLRNSRALPGREPALRSFGASRSGNRYRETALFRESASGVSGTSSSLWDAQSLFALAGNAALLRAGVRDLRLWRPWPSIHCSLQIILRRHGPDPTFLPVEWSAMDRKA